MARGARGDPMIASVDLDARRIASAERHYTAVRRQAQSDARREWLARAEDFRAITKRLIRGLDDTTRERVGAVLSQLGPARNAIRRITCGVGDGGAGLRKSDSRIASAAPRVWLDRKVADDVGPNDQRDDPMTSRIRKADLLA